MSTETLLDALARRDQARLDLGAVLLATGGPSGDERALRQAEEELASYLPGHLWAEQQVDNLNIPIPVFDNGTFEEARAAVVAKLRAAVSSAIIQFHRDEARDVETSRKGERQYAGSVAGHFEALARAVQRLRATLAEADKNGVRTYLQLANQDLDLDELDFFLLRTASSAERGLALVCSPNSAFQLPERGGSARRKGFVSVAPYFTALATVVQELGGNPTFSRSKAATKNATEYGGTFLRLIVDTEQFTPILVGAKGEVLGLEEFASLAEDVLAKVRRSYVEPRHTDQ